MSHSWHGHRALVTGATGIVGSWLCRELLDRGAYVTAFVRDDDPQSDFFRATHARCSIVRGDLVRYEDCARAINRSESDLIFHLGAQTLVGAAHRDPLETFESNIRGTYNVLEAARRFRGLVRALVVASSDKAYGDTGGVAYREDMALRGRHPYDVSKACGDLLATTYAHTYGVPVTITRCGNIFGGGDLNWSRIVPGTIRSILSGERPILRSDGRAIRDYIYVRDVVSAYLSVARYTLEASDFGEAFNFSNESRVSVFEMVEAISALMGAPYAPDVRATAHFEIPEQTLDARKSRDILAWRPSWSLEDGLLETIAWYREYANLDSALSHARR